MKLLNSMRKLKIQAGFTMIELLVVISVIGVLAVAVLSSINPIEQINKGRDTRTRSDAAQLINAVDRYFAIHETYPWNDDLDVNGYDWDADVDGPGEDYDEEFEFADDPDEGQAMDWDWAYHLVNTAEVKVGFFNRLADEEKIYVYKEDTSNATMYACFIPTSNAFQQEAAKNCEDNITPDVDTAEGNDHFCNQVRDGDQAAYGTQYICLP